MDPSKGDPKSLQDKCKAVGLPDFWCEGRMPGIGDIPWWVWALGATGVVAVGTLTYVSFKSAPYVLAVLPETAPIGQAWLQARAGGDNTKAAQEMLRAYQEQVKAQKVAVPSRDTSAPLDVVQQALAAYAARQDQAGRELRSMMQR